MPSFGSLVPCTTGGMMVLPPRHCPNGQRLGPNRVLVGHQPCAGSCHDMPRLRLGPCVHIARHLPAVIA